MRGCGTRPTSGRGCRLLGIASTRVSSPGLRSMHYCRFQTEIRGWVAAIMRSSSPLFRQACASPRSLRFFDRTSASVRERIFDAKGRGVRNDVLH